MRNMWYVTVLLVLTALLCAGIAVAETPTHGRILSSVEDVFALEDDLLQENTQMFCDSLSIAEARDQVVDDAAVMESDAKGCAATRIFTIDDALGNVASLTAADFSKIPLTLR